MVRKIVSVLMESGCYFHLNLEERHCLVKYLMVSLLTSPIVWPG